MIKQAITNKQVFINHCDILINKYLVRNYKGTITPSNHVCPLCAYYNHFSKEILSCGICPLSIIKREYGFIPGCKQHQTFEYYYVRLRCKFPRLIFWLVAKEYAITTMSNKRFCKPLSTQRDNWEWLNKLDQIVFNTFKDETNFNYLQFGLFYINEPESDYLKRRQNITREIYCKLMGFNSYK